MFITTGEGVIIDAGLPAGGVAPVPLYLQQTTVFLIGKPPDETVVTEAVAVARTEISPISDAGETALYKR